MRANNVNKKTEPQEMFLKILKEDYSLSEREVIAIMLHPIFTIRQISNMDIFNCGQARVRQVYTTAVRKLTNPRRVSWTKKYQELLHTNINMKCENEKLVNMIILKQYDKEIVKKYNLNLSHIFSTKVQDLEISVRLHNCLANNGFVFLGDIVKCADYELIRMPNFGRKSLDELKEVLSGMQCQLDMDTSGWERPVIEDDNGHHKLRGSVIR